MKRKSTFADKRRAVKKIHDAVEKEINGLKMSKTKLVYWLIGIWGGYAAGWLISVYVQPALTLMMILLTAFGFPIFMTGLVVEDYQNSKIEEKKLS